MVLLSFCSLNPSGSHHEHCHSTLLRNHNKTGNCTCKHNHRTISPSTINALFFFFAQDILEHSHFHENVIQICLNDTTTSTSKHLSQLIAFGIRIINTYFSIHSISIYAYVDLPNPCVISNHC